MTISGLGLCVLPRLAVQDELNADLLATLPYKNDYKVYSQLFCHASKWLSPNLADFIDPIIKSI
jgi:DNA-binding transcriptional LysR family regulator